MPERFHQQLRSVYILGFGDQRLHEILVQRGVCLFEIALQVAQFLTLLLHGGNRLFPRGGKLQRDRAHRVLHGLGVLQRAHTAEERAAHAALIRNRVDDLQLPDLAGAPNVRRAAGAGVAALDGDDANRRRQAFGVLAKRNPPKVLLRLIDRCRDRRVFGGKAVGKLFDLQNAVMPDRLVEIERRIRQRAVEADVLRAEQVPRAVGQQVLAGVLLHDVEAAVKVDLPVHLGADGDRAVRAVPKALALLVHVRDRNVAEASDVAGLTALVREKRAAVELDSKAVALPFARKNLGVKFFAHGIL